MGKIPLLLWCVHPLTFGCTEVVKILGNVVCYFKMDEKKFQILFFVIIGGSVSFLLYLIFHVGSMKVSQLAKWQIALLTMLFPLIASLYNVTGGVKIVSEYFYVKYWILFNLILLLDI